MKIIITSPALALVIASAQEYYNRLEPALLASALTLELLAIIFY